MKGRAIRAALPKPFRAYLRVAVENEPEDYGHADLLYGDDAPTLVWEPLVLWLHAH